MEHSRRHFLTAISGTALVSLASTWATADRWAQTTGRIQSGKKVEDDLVVMLEETSVRLAGLPTEQRQHTAPLLDALLTTVTELLEAGRYSNKLGIRLHALAAAQSQTVGWHRFDHGHHHEAGKYWIAGLHSAHACGDRDMGAGLLGDLAYSASWRSDPVTAAGILSKALARAEHPAARSLLQLRLARALAARGNHRGETLRALKEAEQLLGRAAGSPMPAWCAWMSEADLAVDAGQCLLDLGDTTRAHQLIQEGQKLLPPSRAKTRGVFLTYQAANHLDQREPEMAAAAALESLHLAHRIGAPRCAQLVRELIPRFEEYRTAEGVGHLLDVAAAA